MKYEKNEEKEKLDKVNEELIKFMRDYPKDTLSLTAIGNSMSDGFSMSEPGKMLLDRNLGLVEYGKNGGVNVNTYQLSRSENNNSLAVSIGLYKIVVKKIHMNGIKLIIKEQ